MVNVQEPRTIGLARNIPDTTLNSSDPKHILCNSTNSSFRTLHANPGRTRHDKQDNVEALAHALESDDESSAHVPVQGQNSRPPLPRFILEPLANAKLRTMMRQMTHEEAKLIHSSRIKDVISNAAEKTLPDNFALALSLQTTV